MSISETKLNLKPNVIDGEELQSLFNTVFSDMAFYVSRTYGPFGGNTAYQVQDKILMTKDGWTTEQGIIYSNNLLANIIRKLIIEVSRSINVHAGDGTSTGVIVANEVNKGITKFKNSTNIHSKFLSAAMKFCVEIICKKLKETATQVTDENIDDVIYRIASVSLDWDLEYAGYIRDIYHETQNPIIRIYNSGYESSYVEYTNGYELSGKLLSEFKVNNLGTKSYTTSKPVILFFTYTITASMFESLLTVATYFKTTQDRELVIFAPDFEKDFRDNYNAISIRMAKSNQPAIPMVMAKYIAEYNIEREMVNDFCFLTGANVISREYNEAADLIDKFVEVNKMPIPAPDNYSKKKDHEVALADYYNTVKRITEDFENNIETYTGTCEEMTISDKSVTATGFGGLENSKSLEDRKNIIRAEIEKSTKNMTAKSMFTDEIKLKKLRLSKLQLKMGTIYVGGFGEGDLKEKRDALDDAINACANAYTEGYVSGGGVAVPFVINKLLNGDDYDELVTLAESKGINLELAKDILQIFHDGFTNTMRIMLLNKYTDGDIPNYISTEGDTTDKLDNVIKTAITTGTPWNMITDFFDNSIIHPVKVETEVVKGCLHLLMLTTTTNQLLYNGYEGIDKEIEGMREIKR